MPWRLALLAAWIAAAAPTAREGVSILGAYWNLSSETDSLTRPPPPALDDPDDPDDPDEADEADDPDDDADSDDDADGIERDDESGLDPAASDDDDAAADPDDDSEDDDDDESASAEPQWITHTVAPRETILQIATRYRVDHGKIRAWNGLSSRAKLRSGQSLRILARRTPPPRRPLQVRIAEGDTWRSIARAHGVDPVDLRKINRARVPTLEVGAALEVWIDPTLVDAIQGDAPADPRAAAVLPGGFSVGTPSAGRLVNGVRVPESDDYALRYPGSAWGTTYAVRALIEVLGGWREATGYGGALTLGAMSRQRGRRIGGHLSHQSGRDVDIRLPLREGLADTLDPLPRRVAWAAVWQLALAFEASGAVDRIFLDYRLQKRIYKAAREAGADRATLRRLIQFPRGSGARRGLIRHSPGHDIHIHVRFRCAPYELECAGR